MPFWETIVGTIASKGVGAAFDYVGQTLRGQKLKITEPRPGTMLMDPKPVGTGWEFAIRGKLKRLPAGHEIWILAQDDRSGHVWPQDPERVVYDAENGEWTGRVWMDGDARTIRIIAVCAPPTSQDFFRYFHAVGIQRDYQFLPLPRIPPECKNQTSVQAHVPRV